MAEAGKARGVGKALSCETRHCTARHKLSGLGHKEWPLPDLHLLIAALALVLLAVFASAPVHAEVPVAVDLHLVLAVDVSGSVNEQRYKLQQDGYVTAFRDRRVLQAIQTGRARAIAVTVVQWTGPNLQVQVLPWTLIKDAATINEFADHVAAGVRRLYGGGTSISGAIDYAVSLFPRSPFAGGRRVIDVSGDGANNRGRPTEAARDDAIKAGIVINGLPILELEPDLEEFYRRNVIGGPNAFVVPVASFEEFGDAILKKLILEIAATPDFRQTLGSRSLANRAE